ncbi:MAG: VCBS repeat-containing protein [Propionibacteriaceae bacterium]|nr:VCBS repeat-containing protein [Propionibacteriaceae bacterium]
MARLGLPTLAAVVCLTAFGCTPGQSPPSPSESVPPATIAPTSQPTEPTGPATMPPPKDAPARIADIDGDGLPDLVVVDRGDLPDDPENADGPREGAVQVVLSSGATQRWSMADLGLEWSDSTHFGAGRLVADLNLDGYADVVVSDPTPEPEGDSRGAIYALWGGPDGLNPGRFATLAVGEEASFTGWSMALVDLPTRVLAVGTQHATGGGVALYPVGDDGSLDEPRLVDLDSPGVPGGATKQNEFGSVLAAGGNTLVIGDPGATIEKAARAGAVTLLRLTEDGYTAERISEATKGVAGAPEVGDEFGWSVSLYRGLLAVGAPGEQLGELEQAGRVYLFTLSDEAVKPLPYVTQDSDGVAGVSEAGDRFGESVTVFRPCDGTLGVLAGGAGEEAGENPTGVGAIQTFRVSGAACKSIIILNEQTAGAGSPPLATEGSAAVLRENPDSDGAETVAAALADGGVVVLRPPFGEIATRYDLTGLLAPAVA